MDLPNESCFSQLCHQNIKLNPLDDPVLGLPAVQASTSCHASDRPWRSLNDGTGGWRVELKKGLAKVKGRFLNLTQHVGAADLDDDLRQLFAFFQ